MESNSFKVTTHRVMLGFLLMASACNSIALTLGRSHGTPVLGQPLALFFDVRLDTEDNVEAACVEAEVLQGDTRVDPSGVRVSGTPTGQVKVATTTVIAEPVVSATLRAGCTQNTRRKYVLLTELAPELRNAAPAITTVNTVPAALAAGAVVPGAIAAPSVSPRALRPPLQTHVQPVPTSRTRGTPGSRKVRPDTSVRSQALAVRKPVSLPRASTPRLQLEPAELRSARDAALRSSTRLTLPIAESPALRASAATQWKSLNAELAQVQDITRTQALEAEVGALQAAAALGRERTADLQKQLQLAEGARYANILVYTLLGLLLLVLLVLVYLWRTKTRQPEAPPDWWNSQGPDAMGDGAASAADSWTAPLPSGLAPMTPDRVAVTPLDIDVDDLLPWTAAASRTLAHEQAAGAASTQRPDAVVQSEVRVPTLPLEPVARGHVGAAYVRHTPHTAYDLDLDVDLSKPGTLIPPLPPLPAGSGYSDLADFDLFDPDTENDIAPKSTRR